ncbi:MAG: hypothetical protein PHY09_13110 [Desulfuromonadaceae bacterium]|nr:hypothetical protein [Desulfuromonadaceae bacterium]MDD5105057.1 hypothetical protein [Desulfuromonadaceae bacterium]
MSCLSQQKDAADILIAITPIVISVFLLLLTRRQAKINEEKLRLDLYNRRFEIYSRALDYFQALVLYDASPELQTDLMILRKTFIKSCEESQFLFEKKSGIYELLKEMHTKSFERTGFKEISQQLAKTGAVDEVTNGFTKSEETLQWFSDATSKLRDKMAPYLNFHKLAA